MPALEPQLQAVDFGLDVTCLQALLACGGQLVDVRSPEDFRHDAVAGAVNLPLDALSRDHGYLDKRDPVILCGNGPVMCERAAFLLAGRGFSRIYYLGEK